MSAIDHYLSRYAEREVQQIMPWVKQLDQPFEAVVTIALFDEPYDPVRQLIESLAKKADPVLIILVINAPTPCLDQQAVLRTIELVQQINSIQTTRWTDPHQTMSFGGVVGHHKPGLLVIDRCLHGARIAKKQGVGLARKIACDCALVFYQNQKLTTPWIHCTDADVDLPVDYFSRLTTLPHSETIAACIYPFAHQAVGDPILDQARLTYELYLYHYAHGLNQAGSPYAYQTTGSLLAVHALYYCRVRGFPKRSGAEDFYLLNKLMKQAPLLSLEQPVITLGTRLSQRVPFGTGPALNKLINQCTPFEEPMFYPDQVFLALKSCLAAMQAILVGAPGTEEQLKDYFMEKVCCFMHRPYDSQHPLPHHLMNYLEHIKFFKFAENCLTQYPKEKQRIYQLHTFFDGFKTLKLIRHLTRASPGQGLSSVRLTLKQWLLGTQQHASDLQKLAQARLTEYQNIKYPVRHSIQSSGEKTKSAQL